MIGQISSADQKHSAKHPVTADLDNTQGPPELAQERPDQRIRARAQVPAELAGMRFDRIAAEMFDAHSRAELARWIRSGELAVDGEPAPPKRRLNGGEWLDLNGTPRHLPDWQAAQPIEFTLVHTDADCAVIDKPAGLVVHPGAGQSDGTLVNGLLHRFAAPAAVGEDPRTLPRAGIVHRLDKDTSGLMVVARSSAAFAVLTAAIAERSVQREYLAIVEGVPTGGFDVDAPIGRDPRHRTRQAVVAAGKPAFTSVRVLERFATHALVSARLETGRTHQIRVHMAHKGFPLVGDTRYGARRRLPTRADTELVNSLQQFSRQALHAWRLGFAHPATGAALSYTAELPADMQSLVALLRDHAAAS